MAINVMEGKIILIRMYQTSVSYHGSAYRLFRVFNPISRYGKPQHSIFAFLWEP